MECETCGRQEAACDVCCRTFCGAKQCANHRHYCYLRSKQPFLEYRCVSEDGESHVDGCQQPYCNFSSATKHNLWMHGHRAKQATAKGCQKRKLKAPEQTKHEMQRAEAVKIFDDAHDEIDEVKFIGELIDRASPEELLDILNEHEPVFTELPQQGGKSPRYPPRKRQRSSSSEPSSSTSSDSTADPGSSDTSSSDDSTSDGDDDTEGICVPQSWMNSDL